MNNWFSTVSRRLWVVVLFVFVGGGVVSSIVSYVLINDAILFLDAFLALFLALFCLLLMSCLLMVRVLARLSLVVSGACGPAFILGERRGFVAVRAGTGSALALPLSIIWDCLRLSPQPYRCACKFVSASGLHHVAQVPSPYVPFLACCILFCVGEFLA